MGRGLDTNRESRGEVPDDHGVGGAGEEGGDGHRRGDHPQAFLANRFRPKLVVILSLVALTLERNTERV